MDVIDATDIGREVIKCVVVGDAGVGKTRLICARALNQQMSLEQLMSVHIPTVWAIDQYRISKEVLQRSYDTVDTIDISLRLWDTFGDHQNDRRFAYGRTDVVVVCFSVVSRRSLHSVRTLWFDEIREFCAPTVPIIVVACKVDLRHLCFQPDFQKLIADRRPLIKAVRPEDLLYPGEGRAVAVEIGAVGYYETSVLTQYGVRDVFENAVRAALCRRRRARFWLSSFKDVADPQLQAPFLPPRPGLPVPVAAESQFLRDMSALRASLDDTEATHFSDVVLRTQTRDFHCHKLVLAAASRVLRRLLVCQQDNCAANECIGDAEAEPASRCARNAVAANSPIKFTCGNSACASVVASAPQPTPVLPAKPVLPPVAEVSAETSRASSSVIGPDTEQLARLRALVQAMAASSRTPPAPSSPRSPPPEDTFLRKVVAKTLSRCRSGGNATKTGAADSTSRVTPSHSSAHSLTSAFCERPKSISATAHARRWPSEATSSCPEVAAPFLAVFDAVETADGRRVTTVLVRDSISESAVCSLVHFVYACAVPSFGACDRSELGCLADALGVDELVAILRNGDADEEFLNDEQVSSFLSKRNTAMVELGVDLSLFTDIRFELADGSNCDAHRFVLAARCEMMHAMFTSHFREYTASSVALADTRLETFQCLLQYLYVDSLVGSPAPFDELELLELANRLCLVRLRSLVELALVDELRAGADEDPLWICGEALQIIEPAQMCNADQLATWCGTYLAVHYADVRKYHGGLFKALSPDRQRSLEKEQWPPSWYSAEYERYEKAYHEMQAEAYRTRHQSDGQTGCFPCCNLN